MSYRDHIDVGIVADRGQVDDAWTLMDAARRVLDELLEVVCGRVRNGVTPASRARRAARTTRAG